MSTSNIRKDSHTTLHHDNKQIEPMVEKHNEKKRPLTDNSSPSSSSNDDSSSGDESDHLLLNEETQQSNKVLKIDHSESQYLVFKISVAHLSHFFRIIHVPSSFNLHYFFNIVMDALDWNNETHRIHPHYYIDSLGKFYGNTKSILQMPSYESSENVSHRHFPHIEDEHDFTLENVFSNEKNQQLQLFYTYGKEWKINIDLQSDKQEQSIIKEEKEKQQEQSNQLVYCLDGKGGEIDESNMKVEGEFDMEKVNKRLKSFD